MKIRFVSERFRLKSGVAVILQRSESLSEGAFRTLDLEVLEPGMSLANAPIPLTDNVTEAAVTVPGVFTAVFSEVDLEIAGTGRGRSRVSMVIDDMPISLEDLGRGHAIYVLPHTTLLAIQVLDPSGVPAAEASIETSIGEATIELAAEAGTAALLVQPGEYFFWVAGNRASEISVVITPNAPAERELMLPLLA